MAFLLIVGAHSDMGRAVANQYAEQGYDLYLAARDVDRLDPVKKDIQIRTGRQVEAFELDVCQPVVGLGEFYQSLPSEPEGVVMTVGYLGDQKAAQERPADAAKIIDVNYTATVQFLHIVAQAFERRGSGFIVAVSSVAGDRGRKSNYVYGSAKAGLSVFLSGLRNRLHPHGVQVVTVKPGFVNTRMTRGMDLPKRLTAQPEEVARDIYRAQQAGKDVLYTKWVWRWVMLIICSIPERLFKRLSL